MTTERLSSMSKNLTAQQLADELNVTRQLIYYHAKKLPQNEKIFDDDKTLVFSPSQQNQISSYMTDTAKEPKVEMPINSKQKNESKELTSVYEEKARIIHSDTVSNNLSNKMTKEQPSGLTDAQVKDDVKEEKNDNVKEISRMDKLTKEDGDKESNELDAQMSDDKDKLTESPTDSNKSVASSSVKFYIQQVLREQMEAVYPVQQQEEALQMLVVEIEEKNQQISTLHKLLDQQQQLALLSEKKHQRLLDTLGVEDEQQLEKIVEQTLKFSEAGTDKATVPEPEEKKSWFKRLFG